MEIDWHGVAGAPAKPMASADHEKQQAALRRWAFELFDDDRSVREVEAAIGAGSLQVKAWRTEWRRLIGRVR